MNMPAGTDSIARSNNVSRIVTTAFMLLIAWTAAPVNARAAGKVALVVGNSSYRNVAPLINPTNDAADMTATLQRIGFSVRHHSDLDFESFRRAIIEFGVAAKDADMAVIFFAGHGVEIDGKNWLIPVDAKLKSEIDVYAEAINLETLIDVSIYSKILGLVILDACRNNPFEDVKFAPGRALTSTSDKTKASKAPTAREPLRSASPHSRSKSALSSTKGLAPVEVGDNILVAYAAAAGTVASDGDGRNSPYSSSLLNYIERPRLEISYLFPAVRDDVVKKTGSQEPAIYGSLSKEEIYLSGDGPVSTQVDDDAAEGLAWIYVRATNDIITLRRFLTRYPNSAHGAEIESRIVQLESAEKLAWTIVEKQNSKSAYQAFLELYPFGDHAERARVTLASLKAAPDHRAAAAPDLPAPPAPSYEVGSTADATSVGSSQTIEKAWDVLKESGDKNLVNGFARKYPNLRRGRVAAGSDLALRRVSSTDWMLRTQADGNVNNCFAGSAAACATAIKQYPEFVQLRFQLCRTKGNPGGCMGDAVENARKRGYLVSAYTRSTQEKIRNQTYRRAVERVNERVGTVVGNVVSRVVSNVVSSTVSNVASAAASRAAAQAAGAAASQAAGRAAAHAAAAAANRAASSAASRAASDAAARAASSIRIPSDIRLKQDIAAVGKASGLRLYRYRYKGQHVTYVGVMAHEVATLFPAAVELSADGYLQVDYSAIGVEFLTLAAWRERQHFSSVK